VARAGFTAISGGRIRFGKDGLWYCNDEIVPNRAIRDLFSRTLIVLPGGRGRLELGEDKADVEIEDTPWVVTGCDGTPDAGFVVTLNDGTREPLDPATLRVGAAHVLYCRVKGGAYEARFLRPAYYELMRHAEPGPTGECVLATAGHRIVIAQGAS
jgi:hypothetical protein